MNRKTKRTKASISQLLKPPSIDDKALELERTASLRATQTNIEHLINLLDTANEEEGGTDSLRSMKDRVNNLMGRFQKNIGGIQTEFEGMLESFKQGV